MTQYNYSSTMVNGVVLSHKFGKKNRKQPSVTNGGLNTTSPTPNFHNNINKKLMHKIITNNHKDIFQYKKLFNTYHG